MFATMFHSWAAYPCSCSPGYRLIPEIGPDALIEAFFAGKSERTIEAYRRDLKDFSDFLGVGSIKEASRFFLFSHGKANALGLSYKQALIERGLQSSTINRRLAALRSLSAMARTLGMISWKLEVNNQKTESYRDTRGPGVENFKKILRMVENRKDKKGMRDRAILRLLFDLGLRRGELIRLDLEDVDVEKKKIKVMGKGKSQKAELSLPRKTTEALKDWLEVRDEDPGPLFFNMDRARKGNGRLTGKSVYRLVRDLGETVGVKTRPHGIRHTAISEALKKAQASGYDLEEVLDFSRHADVRTMMVYRDKERDVQGKLSELVSESV